MLSHLYSLMHQLRTSWHIMIITLLGIIGPWNKAWTGESTKCPDRFVCSSWKCYMLWFTSASNINGGDFSVFHFKLYLNHLYCPENFFSSWMQCGKVIGHHWCLKVRAEPELTFLRMQDLHRILPQQEGIILTNKISAFLWRPWMYTVLIFLAWRFYFHYNILIVGWWKLTRVRLVGWDIFFPVRDKHTGKCDFCPKRL